MGTSTTHMVCHHQMRVFNTSYLLWLADNKKKIKYLESCMGYSDETWHLGSNGHKYFPPGLSSTKAHI